MKPRFPLALFGLEASGALAQAVANDLGVALASHEEREFEDGEHKARPLESVRGRDVFVIHSLYGDPSQSVNDKLCRLLFFLGALRDAGAERLTAVVPYLAYARKDQRSKSRDPVTTRYVASLFEAVGADCVVTLDVHNVAAFQNAFRCLAENLDSAALLASPVAALVGEREAVVVSPDAGGIRRADEFRRRLAAALGRPVAAAFAEKHRSAGAVRGGALVGDVQGRVAIIVDDLIAAGHTIDRAARACREHGASEIHAAAAHGLFAGEADEVLASAPVERIFVTDSVPSFRVTDASLRSRLVTVSSAPLFGEAIARLHGGGSRPRSAGAATG
jgi:ribose-phosphate pyrophosphokinase